MLNQTIKNPYRRQRREQEPAPQDVTSHLLKTGSARDFASARLHLTKVC
jgi:hypothetical protein